MLQTTRTDIYFPNLGLAFHNLRNGFTLFGIDVMYYGIIIVSGMLLGILLACFRAKRAGKDADMMIDFALYGIIFSVIGARLYYVVFAWDSFRDNLLSIFNLRTGGLAIYGAVIGGALSAFVYCRMKKISFRFFADLCIPALPLGQMIGRFGNFFNREAFGKYSDGLFAMQIDKRVVSSDYSCPIPVLEARYAGKEAALESILEIRNKTVRIDGIEYIQVHPMFLYEALWNLMLFCFLLWYSKRKRFEGELTILYFLGYGIGRTWIEGMRTDQLFLWGTDLPVSQCLSAGLVLAAIVSWLYFYRKKVKNKG